MRVVTICDDRGKIEYLFTWPQDGIRLSVPVPPGRHEIELDIPELSDDLEDGETAEKMRQIAQRYTMDLRNRTLTERS
jgi:hypothetical protein